MTSRIGSIPGWFCLLVLGMGTGAAGPANDWLNEVHWIIAASEKEEFLALSDQEAREAFVEHFWQRRDPTPGTPRNEVKEEHYRRLQFASRNFREGIPGWRTDRGRVYVLLGQPDGEETFGQSGGNAFGIRHESTSIVWKYDHLEGAAGPVVLIFQPDRGRPSGSTPTRPQGGSPSRGPRPIFSRSGTKYDVPVDISARYRLIAAGPPSLLGGSSFRTTPQIEQESARLLNDLLRSPGERLRERERERDRQRESRNELQQRIEATVHIDQLDFRLGVFGFPGSGEGKLLLVWEWPLESASDAAAKFPVGRVDLIAQVWDPSGAVVDEFFQSLSPPQAHAHQSSGAPFQYLNEFNLPTGDYTIFSLLKEVSSGRLGSRRSEAEVPPLVEGKLGMSSLMVGSGLTPETGDQTLGEVLVVDQWRLRPRLSRSFASTESLIVLARIYGAASGQQPAQIVASLKVLRDDQVFRESPARLLDQFARSEERVLLYSSILPLDGFPAGSYQLQVTAVDLQGRRFAIGRSDFAVR